jgi:vacuolar protein sorting-associated protein 35
MRRRLPYKDSISDSWAQLKAIMPIIGTSQGANVFGVDTCDTLHRESSITWSKILKKLRQSTSRPATRS